MIGSFKSSHFPLFFGGSLGADITAPSHWSHLHKQAEPVLEQASAVHHPKAVDGELFPPLARLSLLAQFLPWWMLLWLWLWRHLLIY